MNPDSAANTRLCTYRTLTVQQVAHVTYVYRGAKTNANAVIAK